LDKIVYYEHPEIVQIHDGRIKFLAIPFSLHLTVQVRQTKGEGTADADKLTHLSHYHFDLLTVLLSPKNQDRIWTAKEILFATKFWLKEQGRDFEASNFDNDWWKRPISELLRKNILFHPTAEITNYQLNIDKANLAKETGIFDM